MSYCHQASTSN